MLALLSSYLIIKSVYFILEVGVRCGDVSILITIIHSLLNTYGARDWTAMHVHDGKKSTSI